MNSNHSSTKRLAGVLKALGHPTRIEIIRFLGINKSRKISVKQIQERLGLEQVETSRHLIVLKNATILDCEKKGANSYYFINDEDVFIKNIAVCVIKNVNFG